MPVNRCQQVPAPYKRLIQDKNETDKRTSNRGILLIIGRLKPTNKGGKLCMSIPANPLRLNYRLTSTIRYLQRLFIHKKITSARLACLCFIFDLFISPGGSSQKNWVGVCNLPPKTLTLFSTTIYDVRYPIMTSQKLQYPIYDPGDLSN